VRALEQVGDPRASDAQLMTWARTRGYVVFTHDMDFGALLAATRARGPSVLQVRVNDTMPSSAGADVVRVLHFRREALERGALVTIDKAHSRVRVLPITAGPEPGEPAWRRSYRPLPFGASIACSSTRGPGRRGRGD
jgi:predicted nuclease of predicted toxin-antitoxin system